jgi:hypothetical protein
MLCITRTSDMAIKVLSLVSSDENFSMFLRFGESWCMVPEIMSCLQQKFPRRGVFIVSFSNMMF